MHKIIVQIADILFILTSVIVIVICGIAFGFIGAVGSLAAVCISLSFWSILRVIQGNLEKLNGQGRIK